MAEEEKLEGEGKVEFIGGIGGGSFANRSMVAKEGLGGDGFVVDGGRSPSTSSRDGEDGGVENKGSMGSRLIAIGEIVVEILLEKLVELPMCSLMVHCEDRKDTRGRSEEDDQELCTIYRGRWARISLSDVTRRESLSLNLKNSYFNTKEQFCQCYSEKGTGLKFEWHRLTG
ncbi:hypothetical protein Tco_0855475 [Tanacetum coccineum]